mgnify:CR=1 FL=1
MKKLLSLLFVFSIFIGFSQDIKLKEYSHTEFFKMIETEKGAVFKLKDAFIKFDTETDSLYLARNSNIGLVYKSTDTLIINKDIELENVHFEHYKYGDLIGIHHVVFNNRVEIINSSSIIFSNCVFNEGLIIENIGFKNDYITNLEDNYDYYQPDTHILKSVFKNPLYIDIGEIENYSSIGLFVMNNKFYLSNPEEDHQVSVNNVRETNIDENQFIGNGFANIYIDASNFTSVFGNQFNDYRVNFSKAAWGTSQVYIVEENSFNKELLIHIDNFSSNHIYRWTQWKEKVLSTLGYDAYLKHLINTGNNNSLGYDDLFYSDSIYNNYKDTGKYKVEKAYKFEMQLLGQFYDFYKLQHDSDYANLVYIEFKNLETKRYKYLHKNNPTFDSFFTWKINQFLKVFSSYGTNPSLSIVFSLYVIFLFAFVYMLFPNNWENGKKNKLMNRIKFFTKYFTQKEGIKEIYEEEKQHDVMSYEEFKEYMHNSKKEIPSYFLWLTRPIYYFSSYNYKMTGRVLRHTDILKGRWVDLPKRKKVATSFVIGIWIVTLIIIDLLIKFLNALTLSINTFTTLGFGEIPMKGIPRYLAVIQGFIGWFMLTIFSVALISQLLD